MTEKYFVENTGIEVKHFRDTLIQLTGNVKKSVAERTRHQRQYDRRVNKRQMQTQERKVDTSKALDADLVVTESSGIESEVQDERSRSGNDTNTDDANIRPIYNEEPMAEVETTGRIFKSVGLRWIPTGKLFDSCTSKVDSELTHGLNVDILNIHECKQTLDVSTGTSINVQKEQSLDLSACTLCNVNKKNLRVWLLKKLISQKPLSSLDPQCQMTFEQNGSSLAPQCQQKFLKQIDSHDVNDRVGKSIRSFVRRIFQWRKSSCFKSSAVTTADASDKRQQQPDSTSSSSALATTVTAEGNFDL
ncbi:hypothetical protein Tco_0930849 [Tanacetum coccineum]